MSTDEEALLALLNSTPLLDGGPVDLLDETALGRRLARDLGGTGSEPEVEALRRVRGHLQASVRTGVVPGGELAATLAGVTKRPVLAPDGGLRWELDGPPDALPAVRAVLVWADVTARRPGRLRACGNEECRRFLLDRSKGNTARWCSMAVCGNRMKARRHHSRTRGHAPQLPSESREEEEA